MKKSIYIPKELLNKTLATAATVGKRLLEPLKAFSLANGTPIHILENMGQANPPEVHAKEADLWICLEGTPTFTVGGTLVGERSTSEFELTGDAIVGGTDYTLNPGDILYIPAGDPHSHRASEPVRMYIIKIKEV